MATRPSAEEFGDVLARGFGEHFEFGPMPTDSAIWAAGGRAGAFG